jgi:uncharacterized membrane-anchored protein
VASEVNVRRCAPWVLTLLLIPSTPFAQGQAPSLSWIPGPKTVDLGQVAQLDLPAGYVFLDAADTRKLLETMGNVPDGDEVGLVAPASDDESWFVVFDYRAVGYVKDDEKDKIDAKAILDGIREGTEEANKIRKQKGVSGVHVVGWQQPPQYDASTHNLTWAILGKDDEGGQVVNFNVRLLGRNGYVSATLVEDSEKIAAARPHLDTLLGAFGFKSGNKYAEFRPGDKVAEYGLVALVAGGAGAVAAKTGLLAALIKLLAKGGKAVVLLVVAALAGLKKLLDVFRNDSRAA